MSEGTTLNVTQAVPGSPGDYLAPMTTPTESATCVSCGARAAGRFCTECGAAQIAVACATCQKELTPGARFCHHCGTGAGPARGHAASGLATTATEATAPAPRSIMPWIAGGAAVLALLIFVASQQATVSAVPFDATMGGVPQAAPRAPDISSMSPREQAQRLYGRVMRLAAENKSDSAAFFAPMALAAFENLAPFDNDTRYAYGQIAAATGNLPLAGEQADALLLTNPDHLLGLILKAQVSLASGDSAQARSLLNRATARRSAELTKALPEYTSHQREIDAALLNRTSR